MEEIQPKTQMAIDVSASSCFVHLLSAFHAMEPPDVLISFAREVGGGSIKEEVQRFIWEHCISPSEGNREYHRTYLKRFLKKLIAEIESNGYDVLDELYEQYAFYMTSLKDEEFYKGNSRVVKRISFLFSDECSQLSSCPNSKKLEISLQCSLNMLEGDTGCSIWPSSLFLSEFILSYPEIFMNKSCFEVGSGVGLVGICLANVNASSVILSDGDMATLANMKVNLESNLLNQKCGVSERSIRSSTAKCICLPWESATERELQKFAPEIILGADVIYDPSCLPHLVRVMAVLLKGEMLHPDYQGSSCIDHEAENPDYQGSSCIDHESENGGIRGEVIPTDYVINATEGKAGHDRHAENAYSASKTRAVAYIASVIRNIGTFNYFLHLLEQANLKSVDITEDIKPYNLLPYVKSYQRSTVRILQIACVYR